MGKLTPAKIKAVQDAEHKAEFDLERRLWSIPGNRMKMGGRSGAPVSDVTLLTLVRDAELPVTVHGFRSTFRD